MSSAANRRRKARRESDMAKITVDDLAFIEKETIERGAGEERIPASAGNGSTDRILLVEDNVDLRAYISKMLCRFGHQVATAIDGLDGWEHAQTDLPGPGRLRHHDATHGRLRAGEPHQDHRQDTPHPGDPDHGKTGARIQAGRAAEGRGRLSAQAYQYPGAGCPHQESPGDAEPQQALAREAELGARMEELSMSFSQSLEIRDFNTAGHSRDVLYLGTIIAEGIGIPMDRMLKDSLLLHDIGKLGIPDRILLKESPLNQEEWKIMKTHPELGRKPPGALRILPGDQRHHSCPPGALQRIGLSARTEGKGDSAVCAG